MVNIPVKITDKALEEADFRGAASVVEHALNRAIGVTSTPKPGRPYDLYIDYNTVTVHVASPHDVDDDAPTVVFDLPKPISDYIEKFDHKAPRKEQRKTFNLRLPNKVAEAILTPKLLEKYAQPVAA